VKSCIPTDETPGSFTYKQVYSKFVSLLYGTVKNPDPGKITNIVAGTIWLPGSLFWFHESVASVEESLLPGFPPSESMASGWFTRSKFLLSQQEFFIGQWTIPQLTKILNSTSLVSSQLERASQN
jgi:hypothetical protein